MDLAGATTSAVVEEEATATATTTAATGEDAVTTIRARTAMLLAVTIATESVVGVATATTGRRAVHHQIQSVAGMALLHATLPHATTTTVAVVTIRSRQR